MRIAVNAVAAATVMIANAGLSTDFLQAGERPAAVALAPPSPFQDRGGRTRDPKSSQQNQQVKKRKPSDQTAESESQDEKKQDGRRGRKGRRNKPPQQGANASRNRSRKEAGEPMQKLSKRRAGAAGDAAKTPSPKMRISPAGVRQLEWDSANYRGMTEIRAILDGKASHDIKARILRSRSGTRIQISAAEKAKRAEYVLQGKIKGRWVTLPIDLLVEKGRTTVVGGRPRVEVHPREVITMPDGSRVVIGGEKIVPDSDGGNEPSGNNGNMGAPSVANWSPQKFGQVGGTLTVTGSNFADDVNIRIGNVTLPVAQRSTTQIVANLPDDSDDCPPAALRVVRSDGSVIKTCESRFFVRGDKPLHAIVDSSSHQYLNSYLLARLSRWVYNDYHGVSSWTEFQSAFESKALEMGATTVQFVKSGSGPGDTELAIAANPAVIVVVFRGSESPITEENGYQDWINTNADTDPKPVDSWEAGSWVHEGVYNAYNDVHSTLNEKLQSLRNNGQPVFLTGHSLGGALATMAAYRLSLGNIPIRGVYTYGSPRVGNVGWAKAYDNAGLFSKTQRWVNRQDFAPRYPTSSEWRHVGRTNNIHMDGSIELDGDEISTVLAPNPLDHNMDHYCNAILGKLSQSQKNLVSGAEE